MGLQATLARYLPAGDARVSLAAGAAIGVLVCNLCVEREPLYGLAEWAASFDKPLQILGEPGLALQDPWPPCPRPPDPPHLQLLTALELLKTTAHRRLRHIRRPDNRRDPTRTRRTAPQPPPTAAATARSTV